MNRRSAFHKDHMGGHGTPTMIVMYVMPCPVALINQQYARQEIVPGTDKKAPFSEGVKREHLDVCA
jgi:hypothetical protein